ncbi:MAG: imidazole glycerol phosphate synthase subunit HisH [Christensenellaceae bacterium]|jgi:glutamine amidotransferase|nr:imidazole glycerol phosphate synthase subunit HisH [Christensenellaceae bacterium]
MLGLIDYGLGNMFSLKNSLSFIGAEYKIVKTPDDAEGLSRLILPGVGAFPDGVAKLKNSGLFGFLQNDYKDNLLGICLGEQLLFEESEEFSLTKGLGLIPGSVTKIKAEGLKIPHIGWNKLSVTAEDSVVSGSDGAFVYFVHSFAAVTEDKYITSFTDYGGQTVASAKNGKTQGTQFHPEKSGEAGLNILRKFLA